MANEERLIDANELKEKIIKEIRHYWNDGTGGYYLAEDVIPDIEDAPTVDAVEVVHGYWIVECINRRRCSNCGFGRNTDTQIGWNYCPNCGAKMDLED